MRTLICLLVCVCFASASGAAIIRVDPDGGGEYSDIQSALTAAVAGDEIEVSPGLYVENLIVSKAVILRGTGVTVFSATNGGIAISVEAGATLEDLVVAGPSSVTAGIVISARDVTLSRCEVHTVGTGVSIASDASNVTLSGCEVHDVGIGVAISARDVTLSRCEVHTAETGIRMESNASNVTLSKCGIHTATTGISISARDIVLSRCHIHTVGTGVSVKGNNRGEIQISQCTIYEGGTGVSYYSAQCIVRMTRTEIYNHSAVGIQGGGAANQLFIGNSIVRNSVTGLKIYSPGVAELTNCLLYNNNNWGVYSLGVVTVKNCIVSDNREGGVYSSKSEARSMFSCYWNNGNGGDVHYSGIQSVLGDILANPLFVNAENADFHLSSDSPCINAGTPTPEGLNDLDGSPNDMGVYGGPDPFSIGEREPIVMDVTVEPPQVEKGGTFTIRATTTVR